MSCHEVPLYVIVVYFLSFNDTTAVIWGQWNPYSLKRCNWNAWDGFLPSPQTLVTDKPGGQGF